MQDKQDFTLGVVSSIEEDIIDANLSKRFRLWLNRKKQKKRILSIVAVAASFALVFTSVLLYVLLAKQVPVYQGMTVSNEAPTVQVAAPIRADGATLPSATPLSASALRLANPAAKTGIPSTVAQEINTPPTVTENPTYYAQVNENIYIHVHISNPDGFEILSFTLNGVKYSSYMFESGSDLETLILKYDVGDTKGVQQYTIDAIKYVDGQKVKDVRMDGEQTIEVLVGSDAQGFSFNEQLYGWDLSIAPAWSDSFVGDRRLLSLALYEGSTLLRQLDPSATEIEDLPASKRLLLVGTYLENGSTVTVRTVLQTPPQSQGLTVINGVITGIGSCTDTVLYLNMPIADSAFAGNRHITEVYFGSGVTSIGGGAFTGCDLLREIVIPKKVSFLSSAFAHCANLTSVRIECTDFKIGTGVMHKFDPVSNSYRIPFYFSGMFAGCTALSEVYFAGTAAQWAQAAREVEGWEIPHNITVHCQDTDIVLVPMQ